MSSYVLDHGTPSGIPDASSIFGIFDPWSCDRRSSRAWGQLTFFCRVLGRAAGFAVARILALLGSEAASRAAH
jgi:hypothetical protein